MAGLRREVVRTRSGPTRAGSADVGTAQPDLRRTAGVSGGAKAALIVGCVIGAVALFIVGIVVLGEESTSSFSSTGSVIDGGGDGDDGSDATLAPAEVPEGFALVEGDGVSIATPEGWTKLDADDVDMSAEEFADAFPDAPPEMVEQGVDMFGQGAVLVAFDFTDATFSSNVSIIDLPGEAPLGLVEDQARQQIEALGGAVVDSGSVDAPTGKATRLEYTLDVALPDGSTAPASGVQFYAAVRRPHVHHHGHEQGRHRRAGRPDDRHVPGGLTRLRGPGGPVTGPPTCPC